MQITFQDPENIFNTSLRDFKSHGPSVLEDIFTYISTNYGYTFTPHHNELYQEDPKYFDLHRELTPSAISSIISKILSALSLNKINTQTVDIHIIRDSVEICPKQDLNYNLLDGDIIIFRWLMMVC